MAVPRKIQIVSAFAALYLIWGSTYLGILFAIQSIPPFLMAGARFLLAGLVMFAIARTQGPLRSTWPEWRTSLIVGACLLLGGNGGVTLSEKFIETGLASLIVATVPIYITLLGWLFGMSPRPSGIVWLGLAGGFLGVAILLAAALRSGKGGDVCLRESNRRGVARRVVRPRNSNLAHTAGCGINHRFGRAHYHRATAQNKNAAADYRCDTDRMRAMKTESEQDRRETVEVVKRNWRAEVETAQVYRELAARETDEKRKGILNRMAEAEERHAQRWAKKLADLGEPIPTIPDSLGRRLQRWLNRALGTEIAIRRMEAAEEKHEAAFRDQRERILAGEHDVKDFLRESAVEEKAHARALQTMVPQLGPRTVLDTILKRERWHGRGGSWVADAIYGVNDGLGAVFGIVSGVAGATNNQQHYVLISGLAGMLASSLSMGAGAYLAVKSEREVYEAEIAREKAEVEENPEEEIEEMALFYQLQGFNADESQKMAERLAEQPDQMVQAMAQSELGLSQQHFARPWTSAFSAALSTAIGAFIPIIPFFFMSGVPAIVAAFVISIIAHFAVGALKSLITIRSWWASGLEMTIVGVIEAAVTYSLGLAFGAIS